MTRMRALVVEDEPKMARLLQRGLTERGDVVEVSRTGAEGVDLATRTTFDVVVLDVMLPDMDGFEVCTRLRSRGVWVPILMLTARTALRDRVRGLDAGADDYLAKPFAFEELLARLRALTRRGPTERPVTLQSGDLSLDPASRRVFRGADEVVLSAREFAVLETLLRRPGQTLTREQLLDHAWGIDYQGQSNVVDVYIGYLRQKVDRPFGRSDVETVRGVGYRLRSAP
jgi:two-component system OmpR family response regulator